MKPSCLALACSPRKGGNTSILAGRALEGCSLAGCKTEFLNLVDYKIKPCRACGACEKTGRCVIKDDAQIVFDKLLATDRLIVAAPIYSMSLNAQAKILIDRAQQFWSVKYILKQNVIEKKDRTERRGIFISCAGTNLPGVFDGALRVIKYFFMIMEINLTATLCYSNVDKKGDILKQEHALNEVSEFGRRLVEN